MSESSIGTGCTLWAPSEKLSPRVKRLREEYFSFYDREYFRNEVMAFTTGKSWDEVYTPHNWGVVPDIFPFFDSYRDILRADARLVPLHASFWREPLIVRKALFFREVVEKHLPVDVLEGELIVGGQFNTALSRCLNKKEARTWRRLENRYVKEVKRVDKLGIGNAGKTPGHLIPDYRTVLEIGFEGLNSRFRRLLKELPDARKRTEDERRDVLRAMIICTEIPRILARRYAEKLRELLAVEPDQYRREELASMAEISEKVPWKPAGTYWEALQSLWFTHMLVMAAESYPGAGLSHGRFDQYIYPFYRVDIDGGIIDRDFAREILQCYWIKHNYAYDFQGRIGTNQGINSSFGQLVTLSGCGPDGEDLTNDLTYLALDVIEEMNLLEPKPNVRIHGKTPEKLLRRVAEIISRAQGAPFLLNFDELSMEALAWIGLPEDKLWDYAPVGCLENTLQGNDRSGTVDVNINLAKAMELVLFDGRDPTTGRQTGPRTGDPREFESFDRFMDAYRNQTRFLMESLIDVYNLSDEIGARFEPVPYLSTLVRGCDTNGKDVTGGGAQHNFITMEGIALGTTIDSLAAVKKLVFEDGKISMDDLVRAIETNFEGREPLRRRLVNRAPKYGNDDPYVDSLGKEVSRFWTTEVTKYVSPHTGRRYRAGYLSWNYWISYAPKTAATPDGRKRGAYLSNGLCPVNGTDVRGPTSMIKSVGNLALRTVPGGGSHTFSLSPTLVRDEEHIEKLMALLRTYHEHGGSALQINVIDPETLKAAQKHPDEYGNLLVRVTGYNAYFVMLGKEIQDEIIAREAHRI